MDLFSYNTEALSHHDLVFQSPVNDPTYGIPLGDGDTGSLIWTDKTALVINLNKTDLWDDLRGDDFEMWQPDDYEKMTSLVNGAVIRIEFTAPVFDVLYQEHFESRLNLPHAALEIESKTPFSDIRINAFASNESKVTVINCKGSLKNLADPKIILERWGSRKFYGWFGHIKSDASIGLSGTESFTDTNTLGIHQKLTKLNFCVLTAIDTDRNFSLKKSGTHMCQAELEGADEFELTLYLTIGVGESKDEAFKIADNNIKNAISLGREKMFVRHKKAWSEFWSKSFVRIENDYIENLWYLNLYYANSECRGAYPPNCWNGIWGFEHDFLPWNYYFHYNTQLMGFPLHAAGHPELCERYLRFKRNQLDKARAFSEKARGVSGALYADVSDRRGNQDNGLTNNCTPGAQIACAMWKHYCYTGDESFLSEVALPVMEAVSEFYLNSVSCDKDGKYYMKNSQAYEGSPLFDYSITDHAAIKALFSAMYKCTGEYRYKEIGDNIKEPYFLDADSDEIINGVYNYGIGKGTPAKGRNVLGVGKSVETGEILRKSYGNPAKETYYGFPEVEMSYVYPAGIIGISDQGTELYNAIYNIAMLHDMPESRENFGKDAHINTMGWSLLPIILARMGIRDVIDRVLTGTADMWIIHPQGFGTEGPYERVLQDNSMRWKKYNVRDVDTGERTHLPSWQFRYFDYETMPVLSTAVNEMLLQSYDGIIRLFPATDKNAEFMLMAEDGFSVQAEQHDGNIHCIIKSIFGSRCVLKNMWNTPVKIYEITDGKKIEIKYLEKNIKNEAVIEFPTKPNAFYEAGTPFPASFKEYKRNMGVKTCGASKLGEMRMY